MVLRMDSPAPAIKVQSWLRGEPLTAFQPGKLYIVEFWATWCGPCVSAMPHLAELQDKYKDSGLEVVAVAASEKAPTADEAR
ncbi:TlpA disulfide reductase family protein, partial [Mesorhizobium sp. BHbsci]